MFKINNSSYLGVRVEAGGRRMSSESDDDDGDDDEEEEIMIVAVYYELGRLLSHTIWSNL